MSAETIEVVAYSGYRGEEYPKSFVIRGEKVEVSKILNMWIEEQIGNKSRKRVFRVKGGDGCEYKVHYDEKIKQWFLMR
ncbi:MAG: hypothetical protein A2Y81_02650 [Nitrospirae bacterium RBG_13_43_8]|nr:MAG: hypothetical protein A2Y81_02650 [Nitrospirae bacterium RBG_13_43_8]